MHTLSFGVVVMAAAVAAGQIASETRPMPVSAAQRSFQAGQYDQAPQSIAEPRERGGQPPAEEPGARLRDFAVFYQLGLVEAGREDWAGAAGAFERAVVLNPPFAYAHYYAGLPYSRMRRPDQTAAHFEVFRKIAPSAPERGAVASIMRTVRGV